MRHLLPLLILVLAAVAVRADDEPAPWLAAVESAEDKDILEGLVSEDEETRKAGAERFEKARLAYFDRKRPPGSPPVWPPGPRDEMDPTKPQNEIEVRKVALSNGLVIALEKGAPGVRVAACRSIADLGPAFSNAREALGVAIEDEAPAVRVAAIEALVAIRPYEGGRNVEALWPRIIARIDDESPEVQVAAIHATASLKPPRGWQPAAEKAALHSLLRVTGADHGSVRAAARRALATVAPTDPRVRQAYRDGLDDADAEVRSASAAGIVEMARSGRPEALKELVGPLRASLAEGSFEARWSAARALHAITGSTEGLLPVCREALERLDGIELASACNLLCRMGPDAVEAAPEIVAVLGKVRYVRHWTMGTEPIEALQSLGPRLDDVRSAVLARLASESPDDRRNALRALEAVHASPEAIAAFVSAHAKREDAPEVLDVARYVLCVRAPACPETREALERGLSAETLERRTKAARDAWWLGPHGGPVAQTIVSVLEEVKHLGERRWLLRALGRIGTPEAIEALIRRLDVRRDSESAWGALAVAGPAAVPALGRVLARFERAPEPCARVLVALGQETAPVVPRLRAMLRRSEGVVSVLLARAIRQGGGAAAPCITALRARLADDDEAVRAEAARELGQWGEAAQDALLDLRALRDGKNVHDEDVIAAAIAAFQVGSDEEEALAACLRALRTSHPQNKQAIRGLGLLGPAAAPAVGQLVKAALHWRESFARWSEAEERTLAALETLGQIGAEAGGALPVIRSLARNVLFHDVAETAAKRIEAATAAK